MCLVELEPVEFIVVLEDFGRAAGEVVALASVIVRKYGVGEGDLLELFVGVVLLGLGRFVCKEISTCK